ncbi:MAG: type II toxin-antitoxin system ParD family antitoxin [Symploca sp. SIO2D2]|nr:type II toxin-antitoxin system ParD family antitoxin [Symploca sp. SIO2D2]
MNIILNPKLENLIQQQITSGKYTSIDNVLEDALALLEKRNQYEQWVEEIGQKIDIAAQQLERGEGIDGKTAINQLRE